MQRDATNKKELFLKKTSYKFMKPPIAALQLQSVKEKRLIVEFAKMQKNYIHFELFHKMPLIYTLQP